MSLPTNEEIEVLHYRDSEGFSWAEGAKWMREKAKSALKIEEEKKLREAFEKGWAYGWDRAHDKDDRDMGTGDPMNWCPMCGQYYYSSTGHACAPLNRYAPQWSDAIVEGMIPRLERIEKLLQQLVDEQKPPMIRSPHQGWFVCDGCLEGAPWWRNIIHKKNCYYEIWKTEAQGTVIATHNMS